MSDTLVWIDAREAIIVQRRDDRAKLERVVSDVPAHHRSTGHVRHDPTVRHGGGGHPQSAGEPKRIEHLDRFIGQVADHLSPDDDLLILGPGTVHEHLERLIRDRDTHHARSRRITCRASSRLTDRQLIAQLSRFSGHEPRRTTVGAYRWIEPRPSRSTGQLQPRPWRVVEKPHRPSEPDDA